MSSEPDWKRIGRELQEMWLLEHRLALEARKRRFPNGMPGSPPVPKRRGQPKRNPRAAAVIVRKFYEEWRDVLRREEVNMHGHGEHMMAEATRFVCEDLLSHTYGLTEEDEQAKTLEHAQKRGESRRG